MKQMKKTFALLLSMILALAMVPALADDPGEGVLRTAVLYDISTMDVTKTTDDYMIPMNVFDRLFETRMIDGTSQAVGSLCADFSVSEDGLTYNFVLREGVVFSNGSPLTASDVQYSFERLLKENRSNTDVALEVAGAEAVVNGESDSLAGFAIADDTHFSITLSVPNAGFIAELSAPFMSIVDAETMAEAKQFGADPADTIGSGPYIITEWVSNDHYTLVYNPLYWGAEPSVKKLIVSVIPDAGTQDLMFRNGELDIIDLQGLDSAIVESAYKPVWPEKIVSTPKVGLTYLAVNSGNEFLSDVRVRKAIGMALDVESIISGIYYDNAVRENGIIPTGIWGHNDALSGFEFDPDGARALLSEAGYKDGDVHFVLALDNTAGSNVRLVYEAVSMYLEAVGIRAEVRSYDHSSWLDLRNSGAMDAFVARWGMDYNDPANIMYTFFGSPANTAVRSLNYPDTEVMERVSAARAIVDDGEREAEYRALEQKIIGEDAAWIPMFEELHLYCLGDRVASFTPHWAGFSDFYIIDVVLK